MFTCRSLHIVYVEELLHHYFLWLSFPETGRINSVITRKFSSDVGLQTAADLTFFCNITTRPCRFHLSVYFCIFINCVFCYCSRCYISLCRHRSTSVFGFTAVFNLTLIPILILPLLVNLNSA